ncbi:MULTISPECIES: efflux RND transporter permease subunit [unclassified Okeania]|uniref:efflux RND transporter permease subunit n=1 Tax=unclassified Okeania TaxID=2634635 RepID=UPI0013B6A1E9|nr:MULTISPECIES: efflux RND transporter permease subunit [unclassified Okeania]NET14188.1 efflux RND transporter permease subunit [Okeania sp. SIO1H6]NES75131.1 efflux RND transporter permease subunit [Okeania sp. SIO1H4]NET21140.1 efflux RND transporter permease subunit [Okeania sp. SIO1H5]NET78156.1 efflux RND transporter permease subunit [Okeania sp. SIO1F9]NET93758.1 efflux RND transporter permease subunit [Okeania sp. SIO1H2]
MFTNFFIKKPVFASVCSLLIILIGLVGYTRLPVQEFPTIEPPVVSVRTTYSGANPEVVETEVTEILEAEINGVEGVKTLTSSTREGSSSINVQFGLGRDLEEAAQDVRSRVSRAMRRLPDEVDAPVVSKRSSDDERIIWLALTGEKYSSLELSNYADKFIKNVLETVNGVGSILIGGERRYAMRLWLDPQKMAARNITALDVEQALREQNVEIPSGRIEGKSTEYPIRTFGRLQTTEEYQNLIIRRNDDNSLTRLREIGRAEIGAESDRTLARYNGKPAVGLGISKLSGANIIEVANGVKTRMEELSKDFPEGMEYYISVDYSTFVEVAIKEVWKSLFLAICLVVLVIYAFLRDWRATLIPTITIPVSLIGAFGVMYFMGFSINTLTLFALTLSTGLVVDDTIVVLENIVRYIQEEGKTPMQAAILGVGEVVFAVIATTVVLIAVFLPVAFSGGSSGQVFNEFALTIAVSVVLSTFVALTLAPTLSGRILKRHQPKEHQNFLSRVVATPLDLFDYALSRISAMYDWSLRLLMRMKPLVILGFVLSFWLIFWLYQQLPQGFLPTEDRGRVFVSVSAPEGVSVQYTDNVMRQVEDKLSQIPEMRGYFSIVGFGRSAQANRAFAFTNLKPWSERKKPEEAQQEIVKRLFGAFAPITDGRVFPINPGSLPGTGRTQPVQFVLQGNDLEELARVSEEFTNEAQQLPQLNNIDTDLKINKPEISVEIDRAQASNLGVSVEDIARTLQIMMGGEDITNFTQGNQRYDVIVRAEEQFRNSLQNIDDLYVRTESGVMIPLSNVVKVSTTTTPPQINHFNRFRSATIQGSPAPGVSLGEALQALDDLADRILPADMRTDLQGESSQFRDAGQATMLLFALAMIFIFLTLAAQFESYIDPVVILLAVPLSLLGAFGALWLAQLEVNVYSRIGLIMLIGLATKNSILIVEFANQLLADGMSITKAAVEASRLRFRPILMTAFSTIFGVMPLAFASGAGAASRVSIGMSVMGGMLVSTILSLYVVPIFYVMAKGLQSRLFHKSAEELAGGYDINGFSNGNGNGNGNGYTNGNGNGNGNGKASYVKDGVKEVKK